MGGCISIEEEPMSVKRGVAKSSPIPNSKSPQPGSARKGSGTGSGPGSGSDRTPPKTTPNSSTPTSSSASGSKSKASVRAKNFNEDTTGLRKFTHKEMERATRGFQPEMMLGEGGFGGVYKGFIDEGDAQVNDGRGTVVAVKVLNLEGHQGEQEWLAEVIFLGTLSHPNLVTLIGFCTEDQQRMLVYEFLQQGSFERHLFSKSRAPVSWDVRMKVALDAARGLAYLHEEAETQVIYRDFKASNILVDGEFNAKLSDFGLAKDGPQGNDTHVSTRVMGTYGYAAPEYVLTGHLTARSDVFSYGVVLLEIISGRRAMERNLPAKQQYIVEWSRPYFANRQELLKLVDPRIKGDFSVKAAVKAAIIAQSCLNKEPKARPLMSDVVKSLGYLQSLADRPTPKQMAMLESRPPVEW